MKGYATSDAPILPCRVFDWTELGANLVHRTGDIASADSIFETW
jgi:hypothetical protein